MKTIHRNCLSSMDDRFALIDYLDSARFANLFLINIDNFSNFNNAYGFEYGDKILVEIAKLIIKSKPTTSKLFRINSDEFAVVSLEDMSQSRLADVASSMVSFFDQMEIAVDSDISTRASISIGISTGKGSQILNQAKCAIKELREHSRGSYKIYDSNSVYIKKQEENVYWIHKIKDAFEKEKLLPYFQPIINNKTKKIEKYECLVRIFDNGIVVPPIRFMEASRLTGTLSLVTRTIIEQSFKRFGGTEYEFSVNITKTDLYLNYLEEFLLKHAKKNGINPSSVVLEILEDIDSLSSPDIISQLNSLRSYGFKIAIDDFGSQSSNLSRLLEFSPDYLKIDGSFIKNILTDKNSLIIVEAIVLLCKKSNIKIIAEFVHSAEVQAKVEELGIEYSQGFYFSEPKEDL
ncbi:MAG: bifunctional diguanylate cyclase/phosphodiesterase [Sulfurimonas sp.]|uniref:EAL domain-containing protein n=1 Tax=Sulfurimonas sp. TaxID=2022749 RepID=UPI002618BD7D|nr:bifunctional diguanylate cyclase/phosphodiesterase [Sulfurimonas sp.]MDD5401527.1 bifunctional diguanylate cyclase/phosphodiesterase [Sulfurimonas sp.]